MTGFIHSSAWRRLRKQVLMRESVCYLCGQPVDKSLPSSSPWSASVDHVVARARGGSNADISNLHLVHKVCNSKKGDMPLDAYRYREALKPTKSREW
mgnify:CR=1 FL=1